MYKEDLVQKAITTYNKLDNFGKKLITIKYGIQPYKEHTETCLISKFNALEQHDLITEIKKMEERLGIIIK